MRGEFSLLHSGPSSSSSATAVSMGEAQRGSGLSPPSPSLPTEWLVEGGGEGREKGGWKGAPLSPIGPLVYFPPQSRGRGRSGRRV